MNDITHLVRDEIRSLQPYVPAEYEPGLTRLNANETPWSPALGADKGLSLELNRYPAARPDALAARLFETSASLVTARLTTR